VQEVLNISETALNSSAEDAFWESVDQELTGLPVGVDIDNTVFPGDSGEEWFREAGISGFHDIMERVNELDPRGHSNQLNTFMYHALDKYPAVFGRLYEHIEDIEMAPREGLDRMLGYRKQIGAPNIASSAGHEPVIEHITNGHFDEKITGTVTPEGPIYNGQGEKRDNLERALETLGAEGVPVVFMGDSPGDEGGFELAYETGGYAIAIGESPEVLDALDDASVYVVDDEPHYTSAALLNELAHRPEHRAPVEELERDYGFEIGGEVYIGGMNCPARKARIERAAEKIGVEPSYE